MCDIQIKKIVSYGRTIQLVQFEPRKFFSAVEFQGAPKDFDRNAAWKECREDVEKQIALEYNAFKQRKDALSADKLKIEQATREKMEEEEINQKEKKIQNDKDSLKFITLIDGVPAFKIPWTKDFKAQLAKFKDVARELGIQIKWNDESKRWLLLNMEEQDARDFVENLMGGYT